VRFCVAVTVLVALAPAARAQFVFPKPEYNVSVPGTYEEDPFIVKYRQKFFSVFRGDFLTFNKAYEEIQAMLKKDPNDARALVWLGNGQTIKAGLLRIQRDPANKELVEKSRKTLDRAVALRPDDPNIYMMRAATLYIQGQYWPTEEIPRANWEKLRDDCTKFLKFIGEDRIRKVSIHVRGEALGELGIAQARLGNKAAAISAFRRIIELNPGTTYSERAKKEILALGG
jgi:tetratricopeptide (TPR) repeat protein